MIFFILAVTLFFCGKAGAELKKTQDLMQLRKNYAAVRFIMSLRSIVFVIIILMVMLFFIDQRVKYLEDEIKDHKKTMCIESVNHKKKNHEE